ncbi:MAG TPA: hypothetical protein VFU88_02930 [Ktedonobacterales bacterium]|nr:hypothetical protein [Ktedonobacterales bacterium]
MTYNAGMRKRHLSTLDRLFARRRPADVRLAVRDAWRPEWRPRGTWWMRPGARGRATPEPHGMASHWRRLARPGHAA